MKNYPILYKTLFFTYICVVLLLMLITFKTQEMEIPAAIFGIEIDKIVHFVLFFPYPFLVWTAFRTPLSKRSLIGTMLIVAVTGIILALFTEYAQSFNPNRNYDPMDIIANIIAIISGTLILSVYRYVRAGRL